MASLQDYIPSPLLSFLAAVGLLALLVPVVSYVRLLLSLFVLAGTPLRKYGPKGSWAVVTGASDGIGKEFAIQLAQKGFNLVLVSRTDSKLRTLAHEIETKYAGTAIKTKLLAMDFAQDRDEDYEELKKIVDALDVAILVNNVGVSHDVPVPFMLTSKTEMANIITVNCTGTLKVTQIVAPRLVQRGKGLILTMGSFAGLVPTPLLATYSGSKAFLNHWSASLASELKPHGVEVQLILSYLVASAMSKIRRASAFTPNPRTFVRSALGKIGRSGGAQGLAHTSTPYWGHALIQWWLAKTVGTSTAFVVDRNKVAHESIRARALKKLARDAKKST
ncbi:MAG: hypothetical protein M1833_004572 [Piccolia ochrophora]|nr:MAG: hypothetical protein M1833_004572 [Piccolia ochrophora]